MKIAQITNPAIGNLTARVGEGGVSFLGDLLGVIITIIFVTGAVYFFFQLLTGAVAWIGSGGDKAKLQEAQAKLFNAGVGLVILFAAWAIIRLIQTVFDVTILQFNIPVIGGAAGGGGGGGS